MVAQPKPTLHGNSGSLSTVPKIRSGSLSFATGRFLKCHQQTVHRLMSDQDLTFSYMDTIVNMISVGSLGQMEHMC